MDYHMSRSLYPCTLFIFPLFLSLSLSLNMSIFISIFFIFLFPSLSFFISFSHYISLPLFRYLFSMSLKCLFSLFTYLSLFSIYIGSFFYLPLSVYPSQVIRLIHIASISLGVAQAETNRINRTLEYYRYTYIDRYNWFLVTSPLNIALDQDCETHILHQY